MAKTNMEEGACNKSPVFIVLNYQGVRVRSKLDKFAQIYLFIAKRAIYKEVN